jgi:hypothetical protein
MWIRVGGGILSMCKGEDTTPLISEEYNNTGLFRLNSKTSLYYSIVGESGMWSFPSCVSGMVTTITKMKEWKCVLPIEIGSTHILQIVTTLN